MKDIVSKAVLKEFPDYVRGVVVARGVNNAGEDEGILKLLREIELSTQQKIGLQELFAHPRIANWRSAYRKFGVNPKRFRSSIESLTRRALQRKPIPFINKLVALFNYFSLKHLVPSGGDDLDRVDGDLCLRFAKGNEPFTPLGSKTVEYPMRGEVIYVDDNKVLCRCWNWRQGDQTKFTPSTKNIAINIDCLPPVTRQEAEVITKELAELIKEFCGGRVRCYFLNIAQTEVEF